jgi:hypothetical protein
MTTVPSSVYSASPYTVKLGPGFGGDAGMVTRVSTVAFEGIEARGVDVQVQVAPGSVALARGTALLLPRIAQWLRRRASMNRCADA